MLHSFGDAIVSDEGLQNVGICSVLMAGVAQVVDRTPRMREIWIRTPVTTN